MAYYRVSFLLNGERHYTGGDASYPTQKDYESGDYAESSVLDCAMMFVSGYMDIMKLEGRVNPHTVAIQISFPDKDY